jgi:hypothetical protein
MLNYGRRDVVGLCIDKAALRYRRNSETVEQDDRRASRAI